MKKLLFVLLAINAFGTSAQTPVLVHDMIPGAGHGGAGLTTVFNNKLYYTATEPTNGRELRAWDGTNTPSIVYNINPGSLDAFYPQTNQKKLAVLNGKLYFPANNGTIGNELMVYDGTNQPSLVADIEAGSIGSDPYDLVNIGAKILFNAHTTADGYELYIYDGSNPPALYDIYAGSTSSDPSEFTVYNNKVYFEATSMAAGTELFVYNPATNTVTVACDIIPGNGSSNPGKLMVMGNKLYFTAYTVAYGVELYCYDGSLATRLTDINPAGGSSINSMLTAYNNQVYFAGAMNGTDYQLYKYDPATNNTDLVYNIYPANDAFIYRLVVYGNKLYFNAKTAATGNELWVHDGTNTTLVADIDPGISDSDPNEFVVFNNMLCFEADNISTGYELYSLTDPSASVQNIKMNGTVMLTPNPTSGNATLQLSLNSAADLNIQLTDISGKVVWSKGSENYVAGKSNITIPSSEQPAGTYLYRVSDSKGVLMSSGKLTKQ